MKWWYWVGIGTIAISLVVVGLRGSILGEKDGVLLVAVGDVMLGRSVNTTMVRKNNWRYPYEATAKELHAADVVLGNLEAPLAENCPHTDMGMVFCADKRATAGLKWAGFRVMSIANNHIFNQGKKGFEETMKWLRENGIGAVGEGYREQTIVNGVKIGWLAGDDVTKRVDDEELTKAVAAAKQENDVVVVSMHWGSEYTKTPNARQKDLGRKLIDAGADLVIGHHPHWVQTVEKYNDGIIAYSLGNFVFDQMWSEETRKGVIAKFWLGKEGVKDYAFLPVKIYDYAQPRIENNE